jgi:hypothetical protein
MLQADGSILFRDATGVYDPRAGGGLTPDQHKALRQLIHFLDDGPGAGFAAGPYYKEITFTNLVFPIDITWYEDSGKTKMIFKKEIVRSGGAATLVAPTPIRYYVYKSDGTSWAARAVDTITYSGVIEQHRSRAVTVYP